MYWCMSCSHCFRDTPPLSLVQLSLSVPAIERTHPSRVGTLSRIESQEGRSREQTLALRRMNSMYGMGRSENHHLNAVWFTPSHSILGRIIHKQASIPERGSHAQTAQEFLGSWAVVLSGVMFWNPSASRSDAMGQIVPLLMSSETSARSNLNRL